MLCPGTPPIRILKHFISETFKRIFTYKSVSIKDHGFIADQNSEKLSYKMFTSVVC